MGFRYDEDFGNNNAFVREGDFTDLTNDYEVMLEKLKYEQKMSLGRIKAIEEEKNKQIAAEYAIQEKFVQDNIVPFMYEKYGLKQGDEITYEGDTMLQGAFDKKHKGVIKYLGCNLKAFKKPIIVLKLQVNVTEYRYAPNIPNVEKVVEHSINVYEENFYRIEKIENKEL